MNQRDDARIATGVADAFLAARINVDRRLRAARA
jgi:hypothetical protein